MVLCQAKCLGLLQHEVRGRVALNLAQTASAIQTTTCPEGQGEMRKQAHEVVGRAEPQQVGDFRVGRWPGVLDGTGESAKTQRASLFAHIGPELIVVYLANRLKAIPQGVGVFGIAQAARIPGPREVVQIDPDERIQLRIMDLDAVAVSPRTTMK